MVAGLDLQGTLYEVHVVNQSGVVPQVDGDFCSAEIWRLESINGGSGKRTLPGLSLQPGVLPNAILPKMFREDVVCGRAVGPHPYFMGPVQYPSPQLVPEGKLVGQQKRRYSANLSSISLYWSPSAVPPPISMKPLAHNFSCAAVTGPT